MISQKPVKPNQFARLYYDSADQRPTRKLALPLECFCYTGLDSALQTRTAAVSESAEFASTSSLLGETQSKQLPELQQFLQRGHYLNVFCTKI